MLSNETIARNDAKAQVQPHSNSATTAPSFTSSETSAFITTNNTKICSVSPSNQTLNNSKKETPARDCKSSHAVETSGFIEKSANCGESLCPYSHCDQHYHCNVEGCYTFTDNIGNTKNHSFLHEQVYIQL